MAVLRTGTLLNRRPFSPVLAGLLALQLASCGEVSPEGGATIRDSAEVVIVDHGPLDPESLPQWVLEDVPELAIGVLEGDEAYQFYGVSDAHRRKNGSIAVVDRSSTVRVFDSTGTHLWTAGGEGEGPGEFRFPQMVTEIRGDSLIVWDLALNRLSVFAPEGLFARTNTLEDFAGSDRALGLSAPDHLLLEHRSAERALVGGHEAYTYHVDLFLIDLSGKVVQSLGRRFLAREYQEVDSRGAYSPAIFATMAVVAPAPNGFWYGDTESYELRRSTGSAGIDRIVRWQGPDRTVRESDVESVLRSWGTGPNASPDLERYLREYGRTHPRADQFPAFAEILTDGIDQFWVRDFVPDHLDDGLRRWMVFSPDGTLIVGRLTHPETFKPLRAGEGWILGVETDDLGVERVSLRRIIK